MSFDTAWLDWVRSGGRAEAAKELLGVGELVCRSAERSGYATRAATNNHPIRDHEHARVLRSWQAARLGGRNEADGIECPEKNNGSKFARTRMCRIVGL